MKKFFASILIIFWLSHQVFASPKISSVLPNPESNIQDEFIEIVNTWCEEISLQNYFLQVGKKQYFLRESILKPQELIKIFRSESDLWLRDSGDTIALFKNNEKIDEVSYSKNDAQKGNIKLFSYILDDCENNSNNENPDSNANTDNSDENSENEEDEENEEKENFVEAEELIFSHSEGENKIIVVFPENLIGNILPEHISFLQKSEENVENINENFENISTEIVENTIIITFVWDLSFENFLNVNAEKFPQIFIGIENFENIKTVSGKNLLPLNEKSFWNYENISEENSENPEETPENPEENFENSEEEKAQDFILTPILQRSTTASLSGNILWCYENPCKINLNFENFPPEFSPKNTTCEVTIENEKFLTCNPPQMTFSEEKDISIRLMNQENKQEFFSVFRLDFSQISASENTKNSQKITRTATKNTEKIPKITTPPIIIIDSDGDFEKIYEWKNENEIHCFSSKCAINLNANASYSREDADLKFFWKFGNISESNRKNPSNVAFEAGNHEIILTVRDENNLESQKKISVFVPEKSIEPEKKSESKTEKNSSKNNFILDDNDRKNIFIEPKIVIQNPDNFKEISQNYFQCETSGNTCSLNLSLSETSKNFFYEWNWNDEEIFQSYNPRAKPLEIGKHKISVSVFSDKNLSEKIWENAITVEIIQKKKVQKAKKVATTKAKNSKNSKKSSTKNTTKTEKSPDEKKEKYLPQEKIEVKNEENSIPISLAGMILSGALFFGNRKKFF